MRSLSDMLKSLEAGPLANFKIGGGEEIPDLIKFETLWSDPADGWAIASRAAARAMWEEGLRVHLHEWKPLSDALNEEVLSQVRSMLRPEIRTLRAEQLAGNIVDWVNEDWAFHIFSSTLAYHSIMKDKCLEPLLRMRRPVTLYTTFERLEVERALGQELNKLDGMWVPCTANLEVLQAAGVKNCSMIPFPFFKDDPHLKVPEVSGERSRFYWIGRWEPRKAPDRLVLAFLQAFKPGEATLTMKTSPIAWTGKWKTLDKVIEEAMGTPLIVLNGWDRENIKREIQVITGRLTDQEMVNLHAENHIYVSTSRGEGTDLPALQAKLASRRLVTTDSGGPRDFLGERDIMVPQSGAILCDPMYPWGPGATYADHKMEDIVGALQRARADGGVLGSWPKKRFESQRVGKQFRAWTERVKAKCK